MFDNLKNMASMMGQAKQLKENMEKMQAELAKKTAEGESGAGAVRAVVNGKQELITLRLDKSMLVSLVGDGEDGDLEMIEELIVAAVNAAQVKIRNIVKDDMSQLTGGLNIPGLDGLDLDKLTDQLT
jgi:DNA-binding YbaB/EbfC family protein